PCPEVPPTDLTDCKGPQVCSYDTCESGPCVSGIVALCPSPNDKWRVTVRGDGGMFADAPIEETATDADAGETTDGESDAADGESDSAADTATDSGTTDSGTTDSGTTDSGSDTATDSGAAPTDSGSDTSVDSAADASEAG
ncbi:MAG: hypothetical protein ACXVEE_38620, partial [Polyangiales bacterium]